MRGGTLQGEISYDVHHEDEGRISGVVNEGRLDGGGGEVNAGGAAGCAMLAGR